MFVALLGALGLISFPWRSRGSQVNAFTFKLSLQQHSISCLFFFQEGWFIYFGKCQAAKHSYVVLNATCAPSTEAEQVTSGKPRGVKSEGEKRVILEARQAVCVLVAK